MRRVWYNNKQSYKQQRRQAPVKREKPVREGGTYTLDIERMGAGGEGIGRIEGLAVFVEDAVPGDRVEAEITQVKRNYARGRLKKVVLQSAQRVQARCPMALECGGCQIQHMDYEWQLQHKRQKVEDHLKRIGGLEGVLVRPVLGMEEPWRYRNKAQYPVGKGPQGIMTGFYARKTHDIIGIDDCIVQHDINSRVIKEVKEHMEAYGIKPYDETTGEGTIRHILTRVGFATGEVMVVIVAASRYFPGKEELVKRLKSSVPGAASIVLNINDERTNVILGQECITLWGRDHITEVIGGLKFRISPLSFFQVNPVQTLVLYTKVLEYAGLKGDETVIDVYCGTGSISLFLARKAAKVYGIEVVEAAVRDARANAAENGIENAKFMTGLAEKVMPQLYQEGVRPHAVVLDPPRKGCEEALLHAVVSMQPEKVVYVSCNPATLARDLKYLDGRGYKAVEVQPVDMFPHTAHVEIVCLMSRK
jgi:23S rRNA (uracil1939-C5)-methyltransferase